MMIVASFICRSRSPLWYLVLFSATMLGCATGHEARTDSAGTGSDYGTVLGPEKGREEVSAVTGRATPTITLQGSAAGLQTAKFSPDGSIIAAAGQDALVKLWSSESGLETARLQGHSQPVLAVEFSPDGQRIVTGGQDQTIRIWSVAGLEIGRQKIQDGFVSALAFSPDGSMVAVGNGSGSIAIFDSRTVQSIKILKGHKQTVTTLEWRGGYLLSAGDDRTIRLWKVSTGQVVQTFLGHRDWVSAIAISPNGSQVASVGYDHRIRLWDVLTGTVKKVWRLGAGVFRGIGWSATGEYLLVAGGIRGTSIDRDTDDPRFHILQVQDGRAIDSFDSKSEPIIAWRETTDSQTLQLLKANGQLINWSWKK